MLTLILMRHSNASSYGISDIERHLTGPGVANASLAAAELARSGNTIEAVVHSTAVRAAETAQIVANQLGITAVSANPVLYEGATTQDYIDAAGSTGKRCVLIVAHNPEISSSASMLLAEDLRIGFLPANFVVMDFDCDSWNDVSAHSGRLTYSRLY
ncbi:MAG: histidine phosphatase family protein [Bacteroidales bacterium]|nr:histidine phosphatase family protein [Bacteroidales bacterium]